MPRCCMRFFPTATGAHPHRAICRGLVLARRQVELWTRRWSKGEFGLMRNCGADHDGAGRTPVSSNLVGDVATQSDDYVPMK